MPTAEPARPTDTAHVALRPLEPGATRITGGFWALRQERNGRSAIREAYDLLETAGNLENLCAAAELNATGHTDRQVVGPIFMDSDVFKWLEAVAWELGREPADDLRAMQDEVTALVAAAQQEDGYLDSVQQVRFAGERYTDLKWSHELYCAGHLFQAAVAQHRATGGTALLDVAVRLADHLARTFGDGPDQRRDVDGHPIVESALVELFRETGTRAYLDLAAWFVDARGHGIIERSGGEPTYFSDRVPVRDADTVEGHAVRAVYLGAGAVDVAIETGDAELLAATERQFASMLSNKAYITGGLGSRWEGEAFGDPYELPTDRGYSETCAAIGGIQWAWRLLLATGRAVYADAIERLLYNAFLPGVSLAGTEYFYVNPLQLRSGAAPDENRSPAHGRRGWFDCACCPPNIMRMFASLDGYLATTTDEGLQLHQYATGSFDGFDVATSSPFDGTVTITATRPGARVLTLRVPTWSEHGSVTVDGVTSSTVPGEPFRVERDWASGDSVTLTLDLAVALYGADERIDAARGQVAVERGPLVYAVEQADQDGFDVDDLFLDVDGPVTETREAPLLDGVTTLALHGRAAAHAGTAWPYRRIRVAEAGASGGPAPDLPSDRSGGAGRPAQAAPDLQTVTVTAIPYYAWANRGADGMRVWLPRA